MTLDPVTRPAAPAAFRIVLLLLGMVLIATVLRLAWIGDDAYITFRVVDNLANGFGARWNVHERVQPYTHPLWMGLISAVYLATGEPYFTAIALSVLLTGATAWLLAARIARTYEAAMIGLGVLLFSKAFTDFSTSGVENPLAHLLLALFA